jgi:hypothetical protein
VVAFVALLLELVAVFVATEGSGFAFTAGGGAAPSAIPCRFLGIVTLPAKGLDSPASLNE